eukprot:300319-Prymnesium_polylepis.1
MQAEPGCARLGSGAAWSYPVMRWVGKRVVRNAFATFCHFGSINPSTWEVAQGDDVGARDRRVAGAAA